MQYGAVKNKNSIKRQMSKKDKSPETVFPVNEFLHFLFRRESKCSGCCDSFRLEYLNSTSKQELQLQGSIEETRNFEGQLKQKLLTSFPYQQEEKELTITDVSATGAILDRKRECSNSIECIEVEEDVELIKHSDSKFEDEKTVVVTLRLLKEISKFDSNYGKRENSKIVDENDTPDEPVEVDDEDDVKLKQRYRSQSSETQESIGHTLLNQNFKFNFVSSKRQTSNSARYYSYNCSNFETGDFGFRKSVSLPTREAFDLDFAKNEEFYLNTIDLNFWRQNSNSEVLESDTDSEVNPRRGNLNFFSNDENSQEFQNLESSTMKNSALNSRFDETEPHDLSSEEEVIITRMIPMTLSVSPTISTGSSSGSGTTSSSLTANDTSKSHLTPDSLSFYRNFSASYLNGRRRMSKSILPTMTMSPDDIKNEKNDKNASVQIELKLIKGIPRSRSLPLKLSGLLSTNRTRPATDMDMKQRSEVTGFIETKNFNSTALNNTNSDDRKSRYEAQAPEQPHKDKSSGMSLYLDAARNSQQGKN